jgi:hypothetical protein
MSRQMAEMVGELMEWLQADAQIVDHSCGGRLTNRATGGVLLSWGTEEELKRLWCAAEVVVSGIQYGPRVNGASLVGRC